MIVTVQFLCVPVAGESSLHTGDNSRVPLCSCGHKIKLVHGFSSFPTARHKASCTVTLVSEDILLASVIVQMHNIFSWNEGICLSGRGCPQERHECA